MLSQGAIEQSSMTSRYNRSNMINSGSILETVRTNESLKKKRKEKKEKKKLQVPHRSG